MKKLLLLITLITTVAFGAEPLSITFSFNDGARETFSLFSQEIEALKASETLSNMLTDTGSGDKPVNLPMARNTFATILDIVSTRIDGELPFASKQMSAAAQQKIQEKLARLNISELADLVHAADFLNVSNLFKFMAEAMLQPKRLRELLLNEQARAIIQKLDFLGNEFRKILSEKNELLTNTIFEQASLNLHRIDSVEVSRAHTVTINDDG